jgi:hypothetical protein
MQIQIHLIKKVEERFLWITHCKICEAVLANLMSHYIFIIKRECWGKHSVHIKQRQNEVEISFHKTPDRPAYIKMSLYKAIWSRKSQL